MPLLVELRDAANEFGKLEVVARQNQPFILAVDECGDLLDEDKDSGPQIVTRDSEAAQKLLDNRSVFHTLCYVIDSLSSVPNLMTVLLSTDSNMNQMAPSFAFQKSGRLLPQDESIDAVKESMAYAEAQQPLYVAFPFDVCHDGPIIKEHSANATLMNLCTIKSLSKFGRPL